MCSEKSIHLLAHFQSPGQAHEMYQRKNFKCSELYAGLRLYMDRFLQQYWTLLIIIVSVYMRPFKLNPVLVQKLPGLVLSSPVSRWPYHYMGKLIDPKTPRKKLYMRLDGNICNDFPNVTFQLFSYVVLFYLSGTIKVPNYESYWRVPVVI